MDPYLKLAFDELFRKFDELEARWDAREQRAAAAFKSRFAIPERTSAVQFDAVVVADNWGGLFEPASLPAERAFNPMKEQLAVIAPVVADNWGGLFNDVPRRRWR